MTDFGSRAKREFLVFITCPLARSSPYVGQRVDKDSGQKTAWSRCAPRNEMSICLSRRSSVPEDCGSKGNPRCELQVEPQLSTRCNTGRLCSLLPKQQHRREEGGAY